MYPIALALMPAGRAGQVTLFGLAFTACSYLAGFTGQARSMVDAVEFARLGAGAHAERRALVVRAFRHTVAIAVPGFVVTALVGGLVVHALLPHKSSGGNSFGLDVALLFPWLIATLGLWAVLPAVLPRFDRAHPRLAAVVTGILLVHLCAALSGRAIAGLDGLVVAMAVAPAVFVVAGLRLLSR
jgi:hypothetical protein